MVKKKILVVEDDRNISKLIVYNLQSEHYDTNCLYDGSQVVEFVRTSRPDLIVLDLMLPQVDGLEICHTLKNEQATKSIPIIMLTAKSEEMDVVVGLQMGADDYIPKPFSPRILVARVKAMLRRMSDLQHPLAKADLDCAALLIGEGEAPACSVLRLSSKPAEVAEQLYDSLHRLDALKKDRLLVELPPASPEWAAVLDRLNRAGGGNSDDSIDDACKVN